MSTVNVSVFSSVHTVTHVTTKMLNFLKEIIREIGLDPSKLMDEWSSLERAISTWLNSRHLDEVILEVFHPRTDALVTRWDLTVVYDYTGDGSLWADGAGIRYHILKAGLAPSSCTYRIVCCTKPGRPDVAGWSATTLLSTDGFRRYSIGTTIGGTGIGTDTSYWRR